MCLSCHRLSSSNIQMYVHTGTHLLTNTVQKHTTHTHLSAKRLKVMCLSCHRLGSTSLLPSASISRKGSNAACVCTYFNTHKRSVECVLSMGLTPLYCYQAQSAEKNPTNCIRTKHKNLKTHLVKRAEVQAQAPAPHLQVHGCECLQGELKIETQMSV